MINLLSFTLGTLIAVQIHELQLSSEQMFFFVILPSLLISFATLLFYSESPRFLIDQNLDSA